MTAAPGGLAWRAGYHVAATLAAAVGLPLATALALTAKPAWRIGWAERLGAAPRTAGHPAWVHAASVGEVRAVEPLLRRLAAVAPDVPLVLSVTTPAGRLAAAHLAPSLAAPIFHPPLDLAPLVARGLERVAPRALVLVETEIWPNLVAAAVARGLPVAMVNARVSERSFRSYRLVRPLLARALSAMSLVAARSDEDAERLLALGARAATVHVAGNLKFDAATGTAAPRDPAPWERGTGLTTGPWLACASTAEGEEPALLTAFAAQLAAHPELRLLLAPRQPARFDTVAAEVVRHALPLVRRSRATAAGPRVPAGGVLLLDCVGELAGLLGRAAFVFVGGSLVPHGGQNLLEPAAAGRPVLFGPHVENFRDAEAALLQAGGGCRVQAAELGATFAALLADPGRSAAMGEAAAAAVSAHVGATARTAELLTPLLHGHDNVL